MPKPSNSRRPAGKRPQALQLKPSPPESRKPVAHLLRELWRYGWGKSIAIYTLFVSFAAVAGGLDFFHAMYVATIPEIHAAESDGVAPFALPFQLRTGSSIFTDEDVVLVCRVRNITSKSNARFLGGSIVSDLPIDLAPGDPGNARCAVRSSGDPNPGMISFAANDPIVSVHMSAYAIYHLFGMTLTSPPKEFTWVELSSGKGAWIEGPLAKE